MSDISLVRDSYQDLADQANRHHALANGAFRKGLAHALAAGAALNEAKANFDGESWAAWMREHLTFHPVTANWYMRIDCYRDEIAAANIDSFKGAMQFLRKNELRVRETLGATQLEAIYALLDEGLGQTEIARRFGTTKQNVHHHKMKRDQREAAAAQMRPPAPRRRQEIDDDTIEAVATWLCHRFADAGYFARVNDQVRGDALDLLGIIFGVQSLGDVAA